MMLAYGEIPAANPQLIRAQDAPGAHKFGTGDDNQHIRYKGGTKTGREDHLKLENFAGKLSETQANVGKRQNKLLHNTTRK
jgi:hypothetical protein